MKRAKFFYVMLLMICLISFTHTASADTSSPGKQIAGVPQLAQNPELPTGCEATALTMLLRFAQVNVQKTDVAAAFPKLPIPSVSRGQLIGGNPNVGFVGDPFTANGYGVYHAPVAAVLDHFLPHRAEDLSGSSFDQVLAAIDSGRPVVAWITDGLQEPHLDRSWSDGNGGVVQWLMPEHVVIITGYTPTTIQAHDPEQGNTITYRRDLFQKRWEQMGHQAVTVTPSQQAVAADAPMTVAVHQPMVVKKAWTDAVRDSFARSNNTTLSFYGKIFAVVLVTFYVLMIIFSLIRRLR